MTEQMKIVIVLGSISPTLYLECRIGERVPQWTSDLEGAMTFPAIPEADDMVEQLRSAGFPGARVGLITKVPKMLKEES